MERRNGHAQNLFVHRLPRIDDRVVVAAVDLVGQTVWPSYVERAPYRQLVAVLVEDVDLAHHVGESAGTLLDRGDSEPPGVSRSGGGTAGEQHCLAAIQFDLADWHERLTRDALGERVRVDRDLLCGDAQPHPIARGHTADSAPALLRHAPPRPVEPGDLVGKRNLLRGEPWRYSSHRRGGDRDRKDTHGGSHR